MAVDAILDKVLWAVAEIDSSDNLLSAENRPIADVLRSWRDDHEALVRVMPLICVRYKRAVREAQIIEHAKKDEQSEVVDDDDPPPIARSPAAWRGRFRHFRNR